VSELQWLFDLMANERIKLVVEGELGAIDACLYLGNAFRPTEWDAVAFATGVDTFEDAIERLQWEYEAGVEEDLRAARKAKEVGR
jgi:hypothetical protein